MKKHETQGFGKSGENYGRKKGYKSEIKEKVNWNGAWSNVQLIDEKVIFRSKISLELFCNF